MPARPNRTRANANAGPGPVDERSTAVATVPAPTAAPDDADRPVKWTAVLEQATVTRFERVTEAMRRVGRLAGGRYPSRADVLRAMVALVDDDPALADRVAERITTDLTARAHR